MCDNQPRIPHSEFVIQSCLIILSFSQDNTDLDAKNVVGHTPLYVAAVEGFSRIVERIVGYGASVSAATVDGNTPLHVIVRLKNMKPFGQSTPEMLKVLPLFLTVNHHACRFSLISRMFPLWVHNGGA